MITVNYGTGTPQEAAAWVAYANFPTSGGSDVTLGMDNPAPGHDCAADARTLRLADRAHLGEPARRGATRDR